MTTKLEEVVREYKEARLDHLHHPRCAIRLRRLEEATQRLHGFDSRCEHDDEEEDDYA